VFHSHNVATKGKYIAFVSAEVETENPESELEPGLALLGHIDERIIDMYDMYEAVNDSSVDNCFISKVLIHPTFVFYTMAFLLWCLSYETLQTIIS
jgi:RAB protein geranylgeranyltransferase component A